MRHPGIVVPRHDRCSPTRLVSSMLGYEDAPPTLNHAPPPRGGGENALMRNIGLHWRGFHEAGDAWGCLVAKKCGCSVWMTNRSGQR